MAFPRGPYPGAGVAKDAVQSSWAEVANLISEHEPVAILVHPEDDKLAERLLSARVKRYPFALNDAWMRDIGPSFVVGQSPEQQERLVAIDWTFNGWGDHTALAWQQDALVARHIANLLGIECVSSALVNEGGGLHVNGEGLVLLTETVQCDPDRNPDWTKESIEKTIHAALGTTDALWLAKGLYRDYLDHGTRGHVDIVASFAPGGRVLLHQQMDRSHPDYTLFDTYAGLFADHGLDVLPIPAPKTLRDNRDWVDYSYINHYICNGAIICPTFNDYHDALALERLQHLFPEHAIRPVDGRVLFAMGGGVHCITQQQPAL
jgi:agmatine deiminase